MRLPIKPFPAPRTLHCDDGSNEERLRFLASGSADGGTADWEDNCKRKGQPAYAALDLSVTTHNWGGKLLTVRTNMPGSDHFLSDMLAVAKSGHGRVDGAIVPKIRIPDDVIYATSLANDAARIARCEYAPGIIALIEQREAVENLEKIVEAGGPGLIGVLFGDVDFSSDCGIPPKEGQVASAMLIPPTGQLTAEEQIAWAKTLAQREVINTARKKVAAVANRFGLIAIDGVRMSYATGKEGDEEADANALHDLRITSTYSRWLGYHGRFLIHRSQVPDANTIYSIAQTEFAEACRIVSIFATDGRPAFPDPNGKEMIDAAVVRGALKIIKRGSRTNTVSDGLSALMQHVEQMLPVL